MLSAVGRRLVTPCARIPALKWHTFSERDGHESTSCDIDAYLPRNPKRRRDQQSGNNFISLLLVVKLNDSAQHEAILSYVN